MAGTWVANVSPLVVKDKLRLGQTETKLAFCCTYVAALKWGCQHYLQECRDLFISPSRFYFTLIDPNAVYVFILAKRAIGESTWTWLAPGFS